MTKRFEKALIIGGSFAGLWTARVLSDHFNEVVILERDDLPDGPTSRPGVPQDLHVHVLLERGTAIMARFFPGIEEELITAGAKPIDLTNDTRGLVRNQWLPRFKSERRTIACSRLLLESVLRRRVAALDNVEICGSARAEGVLHENGRVTGVSVFWKGGRGKTAVAADFVVDASGRRSKVAAWLDEMGIGPVEETVIDARLGYAGRRYKRPNNPAIDWDALLVAANPETHRRGGLIYSEENDVWMVMVAGILGDYPPTDEEGFFAFVKDVDPEFYSAVAEAEPISKIIGYRQTENRFRHFERLQQWPDRFIVVGDAVCAFNPVYGQGMSVSAMAAEALMAQFEKGNGRLDGLAWSFQKRYPKVVAPAWLLATSADLEWLDKTEAGGFADRIASWYFPKLFSVMAKDPVIHETFVEVQNLTQPPTALFAPKIMWRVFKGHLETKKKTPADKHKDGKF